MTSEFRSEIPLYMCAASPYYHRYFILSFVLYVPCIKLITGIFILSFVLYVPCIKLITGIFILPTERLAMKWFVRKPSTDSPRLLSLSPLRCGADATDVSGEPTYYRHSSAYADLSPHQRQRRSRIGEPIYRREST